jgi:hypothetical protein
MDHQHPVAESPQQYFRKVSGGTLSGGNTAREPGGLELALKMVEQQSQMAAALAGRLRILGDRLVGPSAETDGRISKDPGDMDCAGLVHQLHDQLRRLMAVHESISSEIQRLERL